MVPKKKKVVSSYLPTPMRSGTHSKCVCRQQWREWIDWQVTQSIGLLIHREHSFFFLALMVQAHLPYTENQVQI